MAELRSKNLRVEVHEKLQNYSAFSNALRRVVISQNYICSGNISRNHFEPREKLLNDISVVFLLFGKSRQKKRSCAIKQDTLIGFSLCYEELNNKKDHLDNSRILYIDILGARSASHESHLGYFLLRKISVYAFQKDFVGLRLCSLSYVLGYYRRLGFRHILKTNENEPKEISEYAEKSIDIPYYLDSIEFDNNFYKHPDLLQYIHLLINYGYSPSCKTNKQKQTKRQIIDFFKNQQQDNCLFQEDNYKKIYKKMIDITSEGFIMMFDFTEISNIKTIHKWILNN